MREMRDYQEKMLNSNKRIVMCNWDRQTGKTYSILEKITKTNLNRIAIITPIDAIKYNKYIGDLLEYEFNYNNVVKNKYSVIVDDKEIYTYNYDYNMRGLKYFDGIFFDEYIPSSYELRYKIYPILKENGKIFIMFTNNDIEYITDKENKKDKTSLEKIQDILLRDNTISNLTFRTIDGGETFIKRIDESELEIDSKYLNNNVRIYNTNDNNSYVTNEYFAKKSIEKLMQEFIDINPSDKNTMRRKDILNMIERLYYIEEKYEKQNSELLTITNVIKTSETEANVYFTIGDSKESYMKIVQLDGDFDKNKMLYTVRNLIMQGKAIIYNTYYEMGSTNWYITKIKEYGGICTKISAEKGLILINIECDDIFLNNFEKYIDETKCIGVSYEYNLNCKNKNVDLSGNLMKLKNKNIIKEYKFGKKDNSDITYLEILV